MATVEALRQSLPDVARDVRLELQAVLSGSCRTSSAGAWQWQGAGDAQPRLGGGGREARVAVADATGPCVVAAMRTASWTCSSPQPAVDHRLLVRAHAQLAAAQSLEMHRRLAERTLDAALRSLTATARDASFSWEVSMRRLARMVTLAVGAWALPAVAQPLELRPPALSARTCGSQDATCDREKTRVRPAALQCDVCGRGASKSLRKPECALGETPLGPSLPGCAPLPIDSVPRL